MADTSQSEQSPPVEPQTNGVLEGLDEDERSKMRPADIDADMREMERRKRVEMIMNSRLFREELERIIEVQLKDGNGPAGLLQQLSDMMGMQGARLQSGSVFRGSNCVIPINDIRGVESMGYAKGEKILRCKLAAVYRLMDLCGWTQGIYNHITARLNQDQEHFLINPFGMLFHEITASSLVKIDMQGVIVETGTTNFGINVAGFMLHSAIHAARPDIKCIIHVHTPAVLAVSSLKCGLLPLCQESIVIGDVSNHPYLGGVFEPEEKEKIARNLGPVNKVMFLANHGAVCCGETVEEAFFNVYNTVLACETQVKVMPMGLDNLVYVSDEVCKQVYEAARRPPDTAPKQEPISDLPPSGIRKEKQWRLGGVEFEALMRMLDNAGFRTGYIYRNPLVKGELPRPRNDVEVPPAVSSLGYLLEEEEMYKQGQWKKYMDGRKTHDRTRWLNSPNVYQKVEILETGTPDPKKITKWVEANADEWVADGSPTHSSTPVKIDCALQFVPKNTDPREFKKLQQQIKDNRRADKITSGPQSHILEGVSWEEAKKLQDANISATGDQVIIVGAASKGIIQRGFQHNALVYKTPYAKNPFDTITDEELEEYKKVVERKQRGESFDEDQSESEPLSSSLQNSRPINDGRGAAIKSPLLSPNSAASETEEESRDEPRVLRIETKQVPRPSQAEVVLSDDPNVERSKSLRLPVKVAATEPPNEFKRSWSLRPNKQKDKGDYADKNYQIPSQENVHNIEQHYTSHSMYTYTTKILYTAIKMSPMFIYISKNSPVTKCVYSKRYNISKKLLYDDSPLSLIEDSFLQLRVDIDKNSVIFNSNGFCKKQRCYNCSDLNNSVLLQTEVIDENSNEAPTKYFENCLAELKMKFANKTYFEVIDESRNEVPTKYFENCLAELKMKFANKAYFETDTTKDINVTNALHSENICKEDMSYQYQSLESLMSFHVEEDSLYSISQDSVLSFSSEYYTLCFDSDDSKSSESSESLDLSEIVYYSECEEMPKGSSDQLKAFHGEISNLSNSLNLEKDKTHFENACSRPLQLESIMCYDYHKYLKNCSVKEDNKKDIMNIEKENSLSNLLIPENTIYKILCFCSEWFIEFHSHGTITTTLHFDPKVISSEDKFCHLRIIKNRKDNANKRISRIIVKCEEGQARENCISINFHLTEKLYSQENSQRNDNEGQKLIISLLLDINEWRDVCDGFEVLQNTFQPWTSKRINLNKLRKSNDEECTVSNKSYNLPESKVCTYYCNFASQKFKGQCLNSFVDLGMEKSPALGPSISGKYNYKTSVEMTHKLRSDATAKYIDSKVKDNCWKDEESDSTAHKRKSISKDSMLCNLHLIDTYFFDGSNSFAILHDDRLVSSSSFKKYQYGSTTTDNLRKSCADECPTLHLPYLVESKYCANSEENFETVNTFVQNISFYPMSFNTNF